MGFGFRESCKSSLVQKLMLKSFAAELAGRAGGTRHGNVRRFSKVLEKESRSGRQARESGVRGLNIRDYLAHPVFVPSGRIKPLDVNEMASERPILFGKKRLSEPSLRSRGTVNAMRESSGYLQKKAFSGKDRIDTAIEKASRAYHIPANIIKGIIKAESGFNEKAVSRCGAMGLMQLMPETARELGVSDPFDVEENISGGVKYFRKMLDMFNGNLVHAIAAYNAGPGAVMKHKGIPPYKETRNYVQRVLRFSGLA